MCCLTEIAFFVIGILGLSRGRLVLTRRTTLSGRPAYVVGAIMTAILPAALLAGGAAGIVLSAAPSMDYVYVVSLVVESSIIIIGVAAISMIAYFYGGSAAAETAAANSTPAHVVAQPMPGPTFQPVRQDELPSVARPTQRWEWALGALVAALFSALAMLGGTVMAALFEAIQPGSMSATSPIAVGIGLLMFASLLLDLGAVGLGIAALATGDPQRTVAILALALFLVGSLVSLPAAP